MVRSFGRTLRSKDAQKFDRLVLADVCSISRHPEQFRDGGCDPEDDALGCSGVAESECMNRIAFRVRTRPLGWPVAAHVHESQLDLTAAQRCCVSATASISAPLQLRSLAPGLTVDGSQIRR